MAPHAQTLIVLSDIFAVCRLSPSAPVPRWASGGSLCSITRTPEELSIVCLAAAVPEDIECSRGWRCLRVAATIDFSEIGILASLTTPLAEAGISVFAISTFDTDYLLVKTEDLQKAIAALHRHGHSVS